VLDHRAWEIDLHVVCFGFVRLPNANHPPFLTATGPTNSRLMQKQYFMHRPISRKQATVAASISRFVSSEAPRIRSRYRQHLVSMHSTKSM
jgi:hypothetical protein